MRLTTRSGTEHDGDACLRILLDVFAPDATTRRCLPWMWRALFCSGALILGVVEDQDRPRDSRIVAFGNSVFVSDAFVAAAKTTLPPYLSPQLVDRWRRGESPTLNQAAVRRANSDGGLNLLAWQYGWVREAASRADWEFIRATLAMAFWQFHRGFFLKEVLVERFGSHSLEVAQASGLRLRTDYHDYFARRGGALPGAEAHPYLTGLTRAETEIELSASVIGGLFLYTPPRFFFRPGEQEIVDRALRGETDDEMAARLDLSLSAIKKRWNAIYDRVSAADPALLPHGADTAGARRGAEKRRCLLNYLREHPEELRPVIPSRNHARVSCG